MKHFQDMYGFYEEHHQNPLNKISHLIGIPMIILAVEIMLGCISSLPLIWVFLSALIIYYLVLDWELAIICGFSLFLITCVSEWIVRTQPTAYALIIAGSLFVLGWIAQFVGHYLEGKRPAFLSNILQLLIGPLFLSAELKQFVMKYFK